MDMKNAELKITVSVFGCEAKSNDIDLWLNLVMV